MAMKNVAVEGRPVRERAKCGGGVVGALRAAITAIVLLRERL
jgi:hypothetical protein